MLAEVLVVYLAAAVTPGPNVLLIARTAPVSRRAALATAAGIVAGGAVLAASATFGLGPLVAGGADVMRLICGLFLVYLGIALFGSGSRGISSPAEGGLAARWFVRGLVTNLTNPKAIVFFGSVLTGMLPPGEPASLRGTAVAAIVVCSALWHGLLALALSTAPARAAYARVAPGLNRVIGVLLAVFGMRLLLG